MPRTYKKRDLRKTSETVISRKAFVAWSLVALTMGVFFGMEYLLTMLGMWGGAKSLAEKSAAPKVPLNASGVFEAVSALDRLVVSCNNKAQIHGLDEKGEISGISLWPGFAVDDCEPERQSAVDCMRAGDVVAKQTIRTLLIKTPVAQSCRDLTQGGSPSNLKLVMDLNLQLALLCVQAAANCPELALTAAAVLPRDWTKYTIQIMPRGDAWQEHNFLLVFPEKARFYAHGDELSWDSVGKNPMIVDLWNRIIVPVKALKTLEEFAAQSVIMLSSEMQGVVKANSRALRLLMNFYTKLPWRVNFSGYADLPQACHSAIDELVTAGMSAYRKVQPFTSTPLLDYVHERDAQAADIRPKH